MDQTFQEMRMYYAYLMNGVSQRYFNSFANDPDLRINVLVADYLFLTVSTLFQRDVSNDFVIYNIM